MNRHNRRRERRMRQCKYCNNTAKQHQGLCSVCAGRSKEENKYRHQLLLGYEALSGFLDQSNISEKNIKTIQSFLDVSNSPPQLNGTNNLEQAESPDYGLAKARSAFIGFATIVFEIGQNFPRKKRRLKKIKERRPELYESMRQQPYFDWYFDEYEDSSFDDDSEYDM